MTSAKSCKNPEKTWLIEILRRCKVLPILLAVAYFLINILPILLSYNRIENIMTYIYSSMTGSNILNILAGITGGIVISCAVFKYLHTTASVIDAHARPLTRIQLFRGSFFAGLIMVTGPVVLTGIFFLCVMGAHSETDATTIINLWDEGIGYRPEELLNITNILGWTLDSIAVIGFTYCVSCLAAILAGTAAIQALLSLLLIALPTIVYLIFEGYMSTFLYGYDRYTDISGYLSPYGYLIGRDGFPFTGNPVVLIAFAAIAVLLVFAAALIYRKIKLENEERTIVVPVVAEILIILLTIIAVSIAMFVTMTFASVNTQLGAIIAIVLATAVFFPIFCMIAEQSFRIFKGRNVKVLIAYAAAMCFILAFTLFDVTGFEKKVPDPSDVQSVDIVDMNLINMEYKGITDEEMQALITQLHRSLASTETEEIRITNHGNEDENVTGIGGIEIKYKLKNGKVLARNYLDIVPSVRDQYAKYYDSKMIREHECIDTDEPLLPGQYMAFSDSHVNQDGTMVDDNLYKVPNKYISSLAEAANKDIRKWTVKNRGLFVVTEYDPAKDDSTYSMNTAVDYSYPQKDYTALENASKYYSFTVDDKNMSKYIKEHPEILSEQNILRDDDPVYGETEE